MDRTYTTDNTTFASNPGNVTLNPLIWSRNNIITVSTLVTGLIASITSTFLISYWFIIMVLIFFIINLFYWKRKQEHFKFGDSNGGIIISTKPMLVAITTDLTKDFGEYPVIKIIKYKGKGEIGKRIGTVALYSADSEEHLAHWIDFHPIPIEYATNNTKEIKRAIMSYDENQWKQIEERLKYIPKPFKEGLYKIKEGNNEWED